MLKKKILFVSLNNGSDIRIRKELKTLSMFSRVTFCGISESKNHLKVKNVKYINMEKDYKNIFNLIIYISKLVKIIKKNNFNNIHVVNEELYILLFVFLFFLKPFKKLHVVLDIFDSIFLKKLNISPKNVNKFFLKFYFSIVDQFIITDENRLKLYPRYLKSNIITLENYPEINKSENNLEINKIIKIAYIGTLSKSRGTKYLESLINQYKEIEVVSMGIIHDQYTNNFMNNQKVTYYGNLGTYEMNKILINQVHYLFLFYPPTSLNNIYSSPNKIYDAINLKIPILINKETNSAKFVVNQNLGACFNINKIMSDKEINNLIKNNNSYKNSLAKLKSLKKYSWENIKHKLLKSHNIISN